MHIDYDSLWDALEQHSELASFSVHGLTHWKRVEENGVDLAIAEGADLDVVKLFAVFHDAERYTDGDDPEHGVRAAELVTSMHGDLFKLSEDQLDLLEYACRYHNDGMTSEDVTIGCCWDADRLDLPRVGIKPDLKYMSTQTGMLRVRQLLNWE